MDATDTKKLHPLHALYLGQRHGEVATLELRARQARERAAEAAPAAGAADEAIANAQRRRAA